MYIICGGCYTKNQLAHTHTQTVKSQYMNSRERGLLNVFTLLLFYTKTMISVKTAIMRLVIFLLIALLPLKLAWQTGRLLDGLDFCRPLLLFRREEKAKRIIILWLLRVSGVDG